MTPELSFIIVEDSNVISKLFALIINGLQEELDYKVSKIQICDSIGDFTEKNLKNIKFNVGLFDWVLEGYTSQEMIESLKKNNNLDYGYIVTGYYGDPSITRACEDLGLEGILQKPIGTKTIKDVIVAYKKKFNI